MARPFFTLYPTPYVSKQLNRGGRLLPLYSLGCK